MQNKRRRYDRSLTSRDLEGDARTVNQYHEKAEAAFQSGLRYAKAAGKILNRLKQVVGHGAWVWWLKRNFKGSVTRAQEYMRIAKRWDEVESMLKHDPDPSINQVLKALTRKPPKQNPRPFDPTQFELDKLFARMKREALEEWEDDEKEALKIHPEYQIDAMNEVRKKLRRDLKKKWTEDEIREELAKSLKRSRLRWRAIKMFTEGNPEETLELTEEEFSKLV